jgi:hypothetical protein
MKTTHEPLHVDKGGFSSERPYIYIYCNVLGLFSIHDGTLLHSKSQYTTVKHSQHLFEHTYMSDPRGLGTLALIEFLQSESFQTHQVNLSSGYRSACTPQQHLGA